MTSAGGPTGTWRDQEERAIARWQFRQGKREVVITHVREECGELIGIAEGRPVLFVRWQYGGWAWKDGGYIDLDPGVWGVRVETREEQREREQRERTRE